jgi:hypoxanthine phosphoribosyltransferase
MENAQAYKQQSSNYSIVTKLTCYNIRVNDWKSQFLNVTWVQFRSQVWELSQQIAQQKLKLDLIVTIARGGLTLSQLLSDSLHLQIAAFTVESYKDLKQQSLPHITHGLNSSLSGHTILLVDDICDSGKTFVRGIKYLEELGAKGDAITTAALYYKPHAEYKPDFYIGETSAWVIYPYEVRETIEQLQGFMERHTTTGNY